MVFCLFVLFVFNFRDEQAILCQVEYRVTFFLLPAACLLPWETLPFFEVKGRDAFLLSVFVPFFLPYLETRKIYFLASPCGLLWSFPFLPPTHIPWEERNLPSCPARFSQVGKWGEVWVLLRTFTE